MRNGGLTSESGGPRGTDGVLRAWGLHVCGPLKRYRRLMAAGPHTGFLRSIARSMIRVPLRHGPDYPHGL